MTRRMTPQSGGRHQYLVPQEEPEASSYRATRHSWARTNTVFLRSADICGAPPVGRALNSTGYKKAMTGPALW